MENPVLKAIAERRSIRAYKNQKLTREQFDILLAAAAQAPSANNRQPWHFTVVQNRELLDEIYEEAKKNSGSDIKNIFHGAPAAIFISCDASARWGRLDCGIAVQNIALAAHSIGLGTVILGRPDPAFTGSRGAYFAGRLKFPEGHSFAVAVAVGVPEGTKEAHPVEPGRVAFVD